MKITRYYCGFKSIGYDKETHTKNLEQINSFIKKYGKTYDIILVTNDKNYNEESLGYEKINTYQSKINQPIPARVYAKFSHLLEIQQEITINIEDEDYSGFGNGFDNVFETIEQKIKNIVQKELTLNKIINVSIPNNLLLSVSEVMLREDCCTDSLAQDLKDGWKIISICPQPDQRRPDYILGKLEIKQ